MASGTLRVKAGRGAGRQSPALRLHGLAHGVDQRRPRADETVAGADHGQIALGLEAAMPHGRQQRGVDPREPRQVLGVGAVVLRRARRNQAHPTRVGHDHLMAQLGEQPTELGRVRPHFQHDPTPGCQPEAAVRVVRTRASSTTVPPASTTQI